MEIIKSEREEHFDPELTDLFLQNIDDFVVIKDAFPEAEDSVANGDFKLSERDLAKAAGK